LGIDKSDNTMMVHEVEGARPPYAQPGPASRSSASRNTQLHERLWWFERWSKNAYTAGTFLGLIAIKRCHIRLWLTYF
jgi:hypothetical protein